MDVNIYFSPVRETVLYPLVIPACQRPALETYRYLLKRKLQEKLQEKVLVCVMQLHMHIWMFLIGITA